MKTLSKVIMAGIAGLMLTSGPVSGGPRVLHVFHADMTVDIETSLNSDPTNVGKKNKNKTVRFQACDPVCGVDFKLGAFWGQDAMYAFGNDGTKCFPPNSIVDPVDLRSDEEGAIHVSELKNGEATATFFFTAKNKDSDPNVDVMYQLILTDFDGWVDVFPPPEINDTAEMFGTGWELQTAGKGKLRHTACKGMGMNAEVQIVLTRIML